MEDEACFIRQTLVAWNAIKTKDTEIVNRITLHYLLYWIQRDQNSTYETGLTERQNSIY